MGGGQHRSTDHKCRSNDGGSLHRAASTITGDDAATLVGICVSLLVLITGALVFVFCIELLTVLTVQRLTF